MSAYKSSALIVEVFHSGEGNRVRAPFLLLLSRSDFKPTHPFGPQRRWEYWKAVPLAAFAVDVARATECLRKQGFFIQ